MSTADSSTPRRVALVTGGSRGIGRATSIELARRGYFVLVNYVSDAQSAEATLAEIQSLGGQGALLQVDVSDYTATQTSIMKAQKEHGPIEALINNAGITRDGMFMMMTEKGWHRVMEVNLDAVFNCCKAVSRTMVAKRRGVIINIGSGSGISPRAGQVNYSTSKAAVIGMTRSLARELAPHNVRALVVAPGFTRTEMADAVSPAAAAESLRLIPMGRWGEPEEIATVIGYMCSDDAAYITGVTVVVDGGRAGHEQDHGIMSANLS